MSWRYFKRCSRRTLQVVALAFCFIGLYTIFSVPKPLAMRQNGHNDVMAGVFIGNVAQQTQICLFFLFLERKRSIQKICSLNDYFSS